MRCLLGVGCGHAPSGPRNGVGCQADEPDSRLTAATDGGGAVIGLTAGDGRGTAVQGLPAPNPSGATWLVSTAVGPPRGRPRFRTLSGRGDQLERAVLAGRVV